MTQAVANTPERSIRRNAATDGARRPVFRPAADIYETDENVVLMVDMPSVKADDLDVSLERRVLTIRGQARPPAPEGYRQVYAEYRAGDYERAFTLSEDIDQDRIKAEQKDGVLKLELPKASSAKPRRIDVRSS